MKKGGKYLFPVAVLLAVYLVFSKFSITGFIAKIKAALFGSGKQPAAEAIAAFQVLANNLAKMGSPVTATHESVAVQLSILFQKHATSLFGFLSIDKVIDALGLADYFKPSIDVTSLSSSVVQEQLYHVYVAFDSRGYTGDFLTGIVDDILGSKDDGYTLVQAIQAYTWPSGERTALLDAINLSIKTFGS